MRQSMRQLHSPIDVEEDNFLRNESLHNKDNTLSPLPHEIEVAVGWLQLPSHMEQIE